MQPRAYQVGCKIGFKQFKLMFQLCWLQIKNKLKWKFLVQPHFAHFDSDSPTFK